MNPHMRAIAFAFVGTVLASAAVLLIAGWLTGFQLSDDGRRFVVLVDTAAAMAAAAYGSPRARAGQTHSAADSVTVPGQSFAGAVPP